MIKLNTKLIASKVAPYRQCGAAYTGQDTTARVWVSYFYWVEDVDVSGRWVIMV